MRTFICRCKGWITGRGCAGINSRANSRATDTSLDANCPAPRRFCFLLRRGCGCCKKGGGNSAPHESFAGRNLPPPPPLLFLVAPVLRVHPASDVLLRY